MTVCIAAICEATESGKGKIVVCVDALATTDLGAVDSHLKDHLVTDRWRCLGAGSAPEVRAILPLLRARIEGASVIDETNICRLVSLALGDRKRQKADEYTLGKWALTYDEFLDAKAKFPDGVYSDEVRAIGSIELASELIVLGFLSDGFPILVHAHGEKVNIIDNFATAGVGASLADASLTHRGHHFAQPLSVGLYFAYEAKRHAQGNRQVGEHTHMSVLLWDKPPLFVEEAAKQYLEAQFAKYGPKDISEPIVLPDGSMTSAADMV